MTASSASAVPLPSRPIRCDKLTAVSEYLTSLLRRPPVGWWDLLDIAIVSILFYEFLKLIRGTRAVQMAVGSLLHRRAVLHLPAGAAADRSTG